MTEQEWLQGTDPLAMWEALTKPTIAPAWERSRNFSDRKMRLFVCACARQRWHWLEDERSRRAIEVAERFADGLATEAELAAAHKAAAEVRVPNLPQVHVLLEEAMGHPLADMRDGEQLAWQLASTQTWETRPAQGAWLGLTELATEPGPFPSAVRRAILRLRALQEQHGEATDIVGLLRELLGNPFCAVRLDARCLRWNDATIPRLAQAIYEECAFDRLPILADALEDAGCTSVTMMSHCREARQHVPGCWVVDAILDRH